MEDDTQPIRMSKLGWLTVTAAAKAVLVSVHTIRSWIQRDEVEHTKVGVRRYVSRRSLADKLGPIASKALGLEGETDAV